MKLKWIRNVLMCLALVLCAVLTRSLQYSVHAATTFFVTPGGSGTGTQADPTDLQTALTNALDGDTIYAAAGTYTSSGSEVAAITQSIVLLGGWDGTTTTPVVRDPVIYVSTLDGENSRPVLTIIGTSGNILTPTVDGFTITRGSAYDGPGIYMDYADALIQNNIITDNQALDGGSYSDGRGGGIYIGSFSAPQILDNQIVSNQAGYGGGVFVHFGSGLQSQIDLNLFLSNHASYRAGAIALEHSDALISHNQFEGNTANNDGGAILAWDSPAVINANIFTLNGGSYGGAISIGNNGTPTITNNIFFENDYHTIYSGGSSPLIINNTIVGDDSGLDGAGVYIYSRNGCTLPYCAGGMIINNIITDHEDGILLNDSFTTVNVTVDYNDVWNMAGTVIDPDLSPGTHNIFLNPQFVDPAIRNYHLQASSPCIDSGDGVPPAPVDDFDGDLRPNDAGVDIGADEVTAMPFFLPLAIR
jgi:hypothetical protein